MEDIDAVILNCVDDIWVEYDKDGLGALDKDETKKFVKNTLSEMGDGGEFSEKDFGQSRQHRWVGSPITVTAWDALNAR